MAILNKQWLLGTTEKGDSKTTADIWVLVLVLLSTLCVGSSHCSNLDYHETISPQIALTRWH